ncbi:hypothetical protein KBT16_27165 [Nostoc sp. CCCryo 231-06]|nr:hypothetical protein [Nostoc sp. CCCryo 231-06]
MQRNLVLLRSHPLITRSPPAHGGYAIATWLSSECLGVARRRNRTNSLLLMHLTDNL